MDEETRAQFQIMSMQIEAMMVRINDGFERVLDKLTTMAADHQNTKSFLLDDAVVLGRRISSVEHRLDDLERKL